MVINGNIMFLSVMHLINVNTPHTFIISIRAVPGRSLGVLHLLTLSARFAHLRAQKTQCRSNQHIYKRRGQTPLLPERTVPGAYSVLRV
jgi:hypothetical protein